MTLTSALQERRVQQAGERNDLAEHCEKRRIESRARRDRSRKLGTRQKLAELEELRGRMILGESARHTQQPFALQRTDAPFEAWRFDDAAEMTHIRGDVLAHRL